MIPTPHLQQCTFSVASYTKLTREFVSKSQDTVTVSINLVTLSTLTSFTSQKNLVGAAPG